MKRMYEGATSSVKINGHQYGPIPIRCAVRQRCPMSMALYALWVHPFLRLLGLKLPGIRIGRHTRPTSVVAYADDVKIFVTSAADVAIIGEAIRLYERASGDRLNPWRYYNLRHTSPGETVFLLAARQLSHSTIPARSPPTDDVATKTAFS